MTAAQTISADQQSKLSLAEYCVRSKKDGAAAEAVALLAPLVRADIAHAHTLMGFVHLRGYPGSRPNIHNAELSWQRAYQLGDAVAAVRLGRLYMGGHADCGPSVGLHIGQATNYLLAGIERGNAEASFRLGLIHDPRLNDQFGGTDQEQAREHYKHAAHGGYISAQCLMLLDCQENGQLDQAAFYADMARCNPGYNNLDGEAQGRHAAAAEAVKAALIERDGDASPLVKAWNTGGVNGYLHGRLELTLGAISKMLDTPALAA